MNKKESNMKNSSNVKSVHSSFNGPRLGLLGLAAVLALAPVTLLADNDSNAYEQTNLVSDLPGMAQLQDTNLVNAWGISFSATSPFWISDNGSGLATLYAVTNDSSGSPHVVKEGLTVTIPGDGFPTGQLFNGTGAFHNDAFIFAGEDGFITGWRGALGTTAEILVDRTNAVYKGITLYTNLGEPMLVAANFREGTVDVYDTNLDLAQFKDPEAPADYAPFNVRNLDGLIVVTFAKQDAAKHDDVAGKGHGLIDIFDLKTGEFHRLATGSDAGGRNRDINSPWGVAVAPKGFGLHGDRLLIGNFRSGTIMAFDDFGSVEGLLEDTHHHVLVIDGLWSLAFGNGGSAGVPDTLYFTAGPNGEADGLFGSLTPAPKEKHKH
jgi:uncharacterized protein (TIGR03118 family)